MITKTFVLRRPTAFTSSLRSSAGLSYLLRSKYSFSKTHEDSLADPTKFWGDAAKDIDWFKPYTQVLDDSGSPFSKWFVGGKMNTAYNCLDRHVKAGRGDQTALIFDSPVTNTIKKYSYKELTAVVSNLAAVLQAQGVTKGDRVVVYMPNIPEAAIAMLACARIGAVHSVVFGGFAAAELATRIRDCKPKVILSTSCGIDGAKVIPYKPLLDAAVELASDVHRVPRCIILQRNQCEAALYPSRDRDWATELANNNPASVPCVEMEATDPLYVLYTSGTTGKPKGVLRDNGGHAVALQWSMKHIYNVKPGEVFWAASDVGWVVGHSFSLYGPLLQGATTVLYEGKPVGTPDAENFFRTAARHKVNVMFTAPTALRAIKRLDADGVLAKRHDLSVFRKLFLAGERADPATIHWAEKALSVPVLDHWWQTETGWPICANQVGLEGRLPVKYGSCFKPCPGFDLQILDDNNEPVAPGVTGAIALKLPLPPGCLSTLYNAEERFREAYMTNIPGYYDTGDAGMVDEEGYCYVMSRTDDVINVAGHRLSTGAIEEVLFDHHDVAEAACIGVKNSFRGQVPLGLLVLNAGCKRDPETIINEVVHMVRDRIGPVAFFKKAVVVERLPKTRSGKIVRATLRSIANGEEYKVPATIEDPAALTEIAAIIKLHEDDEA